MSEPIVMGSMQVALLPKSSMSAMADIKPCAAYIMPAWIAWILPNAIVAVGILWLLQNDYKNGGKYTTQAVSEDNLWPQVGKVLMWDVHSTGKVMGRIFDVRGLSDYP